MCDVDDFKAFNDTYGHPAGDACLARVAHVIAATLHRVTDLAARYGGEEFVVVLPSTGAEGATEIAENIRSRVRALEIEHRSSRADTFVTVSIGCATATPLPEDQGGYHDLVACADHALYIAKAEGRDRVVCATAEHHPDRRVAAGQIE